MTDHQWELLLRTIAGETHRPLPVAFIVDSPWLPNWRGLRILDYLSADEAWLQSNLAVVTVFPDRGERYLSTTLFTSICGKCPP